MSVNLSGLWSPKEVMSRIIDGTWAYETKSATELIAPASISNSGGSASISTNGSIEFTSVTSISVNGVFTSSYRNYMLVLRNAALSANVGNSWFARLRSTQVDNASTADYFNQQFRINGSSATASQFTTNGYWVLSYTSASLGSGLTAYLFRPHLAFPTTFRSVTVDSSSGGFIDEYVGVHRQSVSYDGMTLYLTSGETASGRLSIYGMR